MLVFAAQALGSRLRVCWQAGCASCALQSVCPVSVLRKRLWQLWTWQVAGTEGSTGSPCTFTGVFGQNTHGKGGNRANEGFSCGLMHARASHQNIPSGFVDGSWESRGWCHGQYLGSTLDQHATAGWPMSANISLLTFGTAHWSRSICLKTSEQKQKSHSLLVRLHLPCPSLVVQQDLVA